MVVKKDGIRQLGDLVRKTRKMAGLTQLELAEMAGIGKTLVFDIEKGHQSIQLINLIKILDVLNIKIDLKLPLLDLEEKPETVRRKRKHSK